MSVYKDLVGQSFGKLTVIRDVGRTSSGGVKWECQCECGTLCIKASDQLIGGRSSQCPACSIEQRNTQSVNISSGQRFKRLITLERVENDGDQRQWLCRCDCGNEVTVREGNLYSGNTRSCGCGRGVTHGLSGLPEYSIWGGMKSRCLNPKNKAYRYYGGRGITVCDEWMSFEKFYEDMGARPDPTYSLDRIDPNKGYSPDNCRWATPQEQFENRHVRSMSFDHYQHETGKTAIYPNETEFESILYTTMGLVSEAGELASVVKKVMRDKGFDFNSETKKNMAKELGDVLWYCAQLAQHLGVSLSDIAQGNLEKLLGRRERGTLQGSGDNR